MKKAFYKMVNLYIATMTLFLTPFYKMGFMSQTFENDGISRYRHLKLFGITIVSFMQVYAMSNFIEGTFVDCEVKLPFLPWLPC